MKRRVVAELLDTDQGSPAEVHGSLADLRMINRRFGGLRSAAEMLHSLASARQLKTLSWLDVAGSSGDVAAFASDSLGKRGIAVKPVLLDRAATHLNRAFPGVCGDALALPFPDNSFDVVCCSLFLHHLEPAEIVGFVNEALRVARHAVLMNDLVRHPLHLALTYAGYLLYRSRLTRHDAPASVRRSYTIEEIQKILSQTSAFTIETRRFFLFRMGVTAWKRPSTT